MVQRTEPQTSTQHLWDDSKLQASLEKAEQALKAAQQADGHWVFELEADCTLPAEYILMMHFVDEIESPLQKKMCRFLENHQNEEGAWPLYYSGDSDLSCTVKAYYALKLSGKSPSDPNMVRAKTWILKQGGAAKANVFTRITLALFEQLPWRGVPFMPVELIYAPRWFIFHIYKVSYWSRTVMVPLLVLCSLKAKAQNPHNVDVQELFVRPPEEETQYFEAWSRLNHFFIFLSNMGRRLEFLIKPFRKLAVRRAMKWTKKRLNGEHGLGGIFPAMVNAYEALYVLDHPRDEHHRKLAKKAIQSLVVEKENIAYCQPCVSPVWDTALAVMALHAVHQKPTPAIQHGCDWLKNKQIKDHKGDWRFRRPKLKPGGWAFQYENPDYPDLDDTALVAYVLHINNTHGHYDQEIQRATQWLMGMQSENGGFASFEVDNTHAYLNEIPFADHGALLDPPSVDVSARVAMCLGALNDKSFHLSLMQCLNYIFKEQEQDGSWFGRWGTNYIYGTWSILWALKVIGFPNYHPSITKAVHYLERTQNEDGGWGECNGSYYEPPKNTQHPSTSFQTAWALLALMAAQDQITPAVTKGVDYLIRTQGKDGFWHEPYFTAPGFPRVFYLKYHGYSKYFPLWALGQFKQLMKE